MKISAKLRFLAFTALSLPLLAAQASSPPATEDKPIDNGTDPTRVSHSVITRYEHIAMRDGFNSNILRMKYIAPIGPHKDYGLSFEVPVSSVDVRGNNNYGWGDVILGLTHVFGLTRAGGYVAKAEFLFDTADRPELGTGKNVFKGSFIKAWFLSNGSIFAPALVQEASFSGQRERTNVNRTTMDFYYVPKMADPHNLVTFDPNLVQDWEARQTYAGLAVTLGRVMGKAFGGNQIVTVKPSVFFGSQRPVNWGLEVGYKIIGF